MMAAHIEMKAMEQFAIEKLSYDLKLELLENMDPKDIVGLVNVNQGFRSILVREPWRIFGKHVDNISIAIKTHYGSRKSNLITKSRSGFWMNANEITVCFSGSPYHVIELKTFATLISKIRSCQDLSLSFEVREKQTAHSPETAHMLGVLSNFVETQLKHCKSIEIRHCLSHYSVWYELLSKIWSEMILLEIERSKLEELVPRIVTRGIPSLNSEACILLRIIYGDFGNNSIPDLLSRTPGVCQLAHEDLGEVWEIWEKLLSDGPITERCYFHVDGFEEYLREGVCFTRSIDSNRKCIYVTQHEDKMIWAGYGFFFAKYITIG